VISAALAARVRREAMDKVDLRHRSVERHAAYPVDCRVIGKGECR
jgi:hypothetical protein